MDALSQTNVTDFSAALAADLAAELYDEETLFKNHGLSVEVGEHLMAQEWFKAMIAQAKRDWESVGNAKDRIRIKAQITLEEALPTMYGIITDKNTPGAARVAAFKEVKEIAGMGAKESEGAGASFVPIQIFLDGRDKPPLTVGVLPMGKDPEVLEDETDDAEVILPVPEVKIMPREERIRTKEDGFFLGMETE